MTVYVTGPTAVLAALGAPMLMVGAMLSTVRVASVVSLFVTVFVAVTPDTVPNIV